MASPTTRRASTLPSARLRKLSVVGLAAFLLLGATACRKDKDPGEDLVDEPSSLAEDGTDSNAAETDTEIVTSSLVSATAQGGSLTLASTGDLGGEGLSARAIGDGAKALYFPKGCLTVTSDEATRTVTYGFEGCSGPNGIFKIRGTVVATYAVSTGKLVLALVGTDLVINRATVDWTANAELTTEGANRTMRWKGTLAGNTPRGKTFSRTNEKVVTWRLGERCFGVSGVSEGEVRGRYLRTTIADFRRCQGACPEAGGRITITNAGAKVKVEILFDGSDRATFTGPRGSTTFGLACRG